MRSLMAVCLCACAFFCVACSEIDLLNGEPAHTLELDGSVGMSSTPPRYRDERPWGHGDPPMRLQAANGWVWVRSHKIEYVDSLPVEPETIDDDIDVRGLNPEPDPFESSDYEYGYYFRMIGDIGGWEYHMSDESIRRLGEYMRHREIARREGRQDIPDLYEAPGVSEGLADIGRHTKEGLGLIADLEHDRLSNAMVIGTDERVPFDAWAGVYPLSVHGSIRVAISTGYQSTCTVFKAVNHGSAATAAHCLYSKKDGSWFKRRPIQFKAGLVGTGSGAPPVVPDDCYGRFLSPNYMSHPNLAKNDYAVIILTGDGLSFCAPNTFNFGYVGWKSVPVNPSFESYLFGYPSGDPLPPGWPSLMTLSYSVMSDGIGQTIFQPNVVRHKHDATGGQSGTALLSYSSTMGYQARAIHKGEGAGNYNRGREFNATVADWINAYLED